MDTFELKEQKICELIIALGVEKWSQQARDIEPLRRLLPESEREKAGHIMPYLITEEVVEGRSTGGTQTYFFHDAAPDPQDPNKRYLYIDSKTNLSLPVTLTSGQKKGEPMRIEYVYGTYGEIQGKRSQNQKS